MRAALLLLVMAAACQTPPARQPPALYGVIFRVQVSPAGEIEAFNVSSVVDPFGSGVLLEIDPDWLAMACMVFETQTKADPSPTYDGDEEPRAGYVPYFYDRERPKAFFGKDPETPVLFAPAGLAAGMHDGTGDSKVCAGEIARPAA